MFDSLFLSQDGFLLPLLHLTYMLLKLLSMISFLIITLFGGRSWLPKWVDRRGILQQWNFKLLLGILIFKLSGHFLWHFIALGFGSIISAFISLIWFFCFFYDLILLLSGKLFGLRFFDLLKHLLDIDKWRLALSDEAPVALAASEATLTMSLHFIGLQLKEAAQNEVTVKELWKLMVIFYQFIKNTRATLVVLLDLADALLQGWFLIDLGEIIDLWVRSIVTRRVMKLSEWLWLRSRSRGPRLRKLDCLEIARLWASRVGLKWIREIVLLEWYAFLVAIGARNLRIIGKIIGQSPYILVSSRSNGRAIADLVCPLQILALKVVCASLARNDLASCDELISIMPLTSQSVVLIRLLNDWVMLCNIICLSRVQFINLNLIPIACSCIFVWLHSLIKVIQNILAFKTTRSFIKVFRFKTLRTVPSQSIFKTMRAEFGAVAILIEVLSQITRSYMLFSVFTYSCLLDLARCILTNLTIWLCWHLCFTSRISCLRSVVRGDGQVISFGAFDDSLRCSTQAFLLRSHILAKLCLDLTLADLCWQGGCEVGSWLKILICPELSYLI